MDQLTIENASLWSALLGYTLATVVSLVSTVFRRRPEKTLMFLVASATLLHSVAIGLRWFRVGYVPVGSAFEMLSANIWGLMVAVTIAYWLLPRFRAFVAVVMPVVIMIMAWMLLKPTDETSLPPTYDTVWLYIHIAFIKLFLGSAFVALGMSGIVLLRLTQVGVRWFGGLPDDRVIDGRIHQFMALALIFDTLGIVAGAIWAHDAWGRYWSWDPLEVWSLITWLSIGLSLHLRASFKTSPVTNSLLVCTVFVVAFFTFFGIPFVSTALHKGQI